MMFKTGDIFHCSGERLLSRLIKRFTKSKFSHSAVFIEIWNQAYVMDSQSKGTNLIPFDEWEKKWNYTYEVHRSPLLFDETKRREFAIKALSRSGNTGYDFISLLIRQPLYLITGKWKEKESRKHKRMYCSEFVAWSHGIESSYRMSPQDLYEYCNNNDFIKLSN